MTAPQIKVGDTVETIAQLAELLDGSVIAAPGESVPAVKRRGRWRVSDTYTIDAGDVLASLPAATVLRVGAGL